VVLHARAKASVEAASTQRFLEFEENNILLVSDILHTDKRNFFRQLASKHP